jgi:hypothetical protein
VVADATVARERDLGTNDHTALIRTHLVGKLESGDEALGYDLESMTHVEGAEGGPPAILVEKKVERVKARARRAGAVARRRRRREGGADDRSSCSTTSYQTLACCGARIQWFSCGKYRNRWSVVPSAAAGRPDFASSSDHRRSPSPSDVMQALHNSGVSRCAFVIVIFPPFFCFLSFA